MLTCIIETCKQHNLNKYSCSRFWVLFGISHSLYLDTLIYGRCTSVSEARVDNLMPLLIFIVEHIKESKFCRVT